MFRIYIPAFMDDLVYCEDCGIVLNSKVIKEKEDKHGLVNCPVCKEEGFIEE